MKDRYSFLDEYYTEILNRALYPLHYKFVDACLYTLSYTMLTDAELRARFSYMAYEQHDATMKGDVVLAEKANERIALLLEQVMSGEPEKFIFPLDEVSASKIKETNYFDLLWANREHPVIKSHLIQVISNELNTLIQSMLIHSTQRIQRELQSVKQEYGEHFREVFSFHKRYVNRYIRSTQIDRVWSVERDGRDTKSPSPFQVPGRILEEMDRFEYYEFVPHKPVDPFIPFQLPGKILREGHHFQYYEFVPLKLVEMLVINLAKPNLFEIIKSQQILNRHEIHKLSIMDQVFAKLLDTLVNDISSVLATASQKLLFLSERVLNRNENLAMLMEFINLLPPKHQLDLVEFIHLRAPQNTLQIFEFLSTKAPQNRLNLIEFINLKETQKTIALSEGLFLLEEPVRELFLKQFYPVSLENEAIVSELVLLAIDQRTMVIHELPVVEHMEKQIDIVLLVTIEKFVKDMNLGQFVDVEKDEKEFDLTEFQVIDSVEKLLNRLYGGSFFGKEYYLEVEKLTILNIFKSIKELLDPKAFLTIGKMPLDIYLHKVVNEACIVAKDRVDSSIQEFEELIYKVERSIVEQKDWLWIGTKDGTKEINLIDLNQYVKEEKDTKVNRYQITPSVVQSELMESGNRYETLSKYVQDIVKFPNVLTPGKLFPYGLQLGDPVIVDDSIKEVRYTPNLLTSKKNYPDGEVFENLVEIQTPDTKVHFDSNKIMLENPFPYGMVFIDLFRSQSMDTRVQIDSGIVRLNVEKESRLITDIVKAESTKTAQDIFKFITPVTINESRIIFDVITTELSKQAQFIPSPIMLNSSTEARFTPDFIILETDKEIQTVFDFIVNEKSSSKTIRLIDSLISELIGKDTHISYSPEAVEKLSGYNTIFGRPLVTQFLGRAMQHTAEIVTPNRVLPYDMDFLYPTIAQFLGRTTQHLSSIVAPSKDYPYGIKLIDFIKVNLDKIQVQKLYDFVKLGREIPNGFKFLDNVLAHLDNIAVRVIYDLVPVKNLILDGLKFYSSVGGKYIADALNIQDFIMSVMFKEGQTRSYEITSKLVKDTQLIIDVMWSNENKEAQIISNPISSEAFIEGSIAFDFIKSVTGKEIQSSFNFITLEKMFQDSTVVQDFIKVVSIDREAQSDFNFISLEKLWEQGSLFKDFIKFESIEKQIKFVNDFGIIEKSSQDIITLDDFIKIQTMGKEIQSIINPFIVEKKFPYDIIFTEFMGVQASITQAQSIFDNIFLKSSLSQSIVVASTILVQPSITEAQFIYDAVLLEKSLSQGMRFKDIIMGLFSERDTKLIPNFMFVGKDINSGKLFLDISMISIPIKETQFALKFITPGKVFPYIFKLLDPTMFWSNIKNIESALRPMLVEKPLQHSEVSAYLINAQSRDTNLKVLDEFNKVSSNERWMFTAEDLERAYKTRPQAEVIGDIVVVKGAKQAVFVDKMFVDLARDFVEALVEKDSTLYDIFDKEILSPDGFQIIESDENIINVAKYYELATSPEFDTTVSFLTWLDDKLERDIYVPISGLSLIQKPAQEVVCPVTLRFSDTENRLIDLLTYSGFIRTEYIMGQIRLNREYSIAETKETVVDITDYVFVNLEKIREVFTEFSLIPLSREEFVDALISPGLEWMEREFRELWNRWDMVDRLPEAREAYLMKDMLDRLPEQQPMYLIKDPLFYIRDTRGWYDDIRKFICTRYTRAVSKLIPLVWRNLLQRDTNILDEVKVDKAEHLGQSIPFVEFMESSERRFKVSEIESLEYSERQAEITETTWLESLEKLAIIEGFLINVQAQKYEVIIELVILSDRDPLKIVLGEFQFYQREAKDMVYIESEQYDYQERIIKLLEEQIKVDKTEKEVLHQEMVKIIREPGNLELFQKLLLDKIEHAIIKTQGTQVEAIDKFVHILENVSFEREGKIIELLAEFALLEMYQRWHFMPSDGPYDTMILPDDYPYARLPVHGIFEHPLPWGEDKGTTEIPVDIKIMANVIDFCRELWFANLRLYTRYTPEQALKHFVKNVYDWLVKYTPETGFKPPEFYFNTYGYYDTNKVVPEDYWRLYRWIRWYAESLTMNIPLSDVKDINMGGIYVRRLIDDLIKYFNDHHGVYGAPGQKRINKIKGQRHIFIKGDEHNGNEI